MKRFFVLALLASGVALGAAQEHKASKGSAQAQSSAESNAQAVGAPQVGANQDEASEAELKITDQDRQLLAFLKSKLKPRSLGINRIKPGDLATLSNAQRALTAYYYDVKDVPQLEMIMLAAKLAIDDIKQRVEAEYALKHSELRKSALYREPKKNKAAQGVSLQ